MCVFACLKAHLGGSVSKHLKSLGQLVEKLRWQRVKKKKKDLLFKNYCFRKMIY